MAPSRAERARTLVAGGHRATLSTLARDPDGHPFGSFVTYTADDAGAPLVLLPAMAEPALDLAVDPRASMLVAAGGDGHDGYDDGGDAMAHGIPRATLVGTLDRLPESQQGAALATYLASLPGAYWAGFPDFFVARLELETLHYVRGFGEAGWVDADGYAAAEPDPVAPSEAAVVAHMNDDHADALVAMAQHFLDVESRVTRATMVSCDRYGFWVRMRLADGAGIGRLGFDEPLASAKGARGAMVRLTRTARGG